jgi:hypothetical protein
VAKVTFKHVEEDGYFTFQLADGVAITVSAKGYTTDDPHVIAELDACRFVKRSKPAGASGKGA